MITHNIQEVKKQKKVEPTKIIIVEGLFVLEDVKIRELLDIKIFR